MLDFELSYLSIHITSFDFFFLATKRLFTKNSRLSFKTYNEFIHIWTSSARVLKHMLFSIQRRIHNSKDNLKV